MKQKRTLRISFLTILLGVLCSVVFFNFSGCVKIPGQIEIAGSDIMQRTGVMVETCDEAQFPRRDLQSDGVDPDGFSILSWNTHKGTYNGFKDDLKLFASNANFLLLQEAALGDDMKGHLRQIAEQWLLAVAFRTGKTDFGIMTLSSVVPGFYCAVREPEPLILIPKMALASIYPLAGKSEELLIVNVHVVNFTLNGTAVRRQLEALTSLIANHQGPVIVAGDFNTWNKSRKNAVDTKMKSLQLVPVTFDPDLRTEFLNNRVDAVYYRGLEVVESISLQVESSDHNPLEVYFRIPDTEKG